MLATASIVKRASVEHEPDQVTAHTQQQPGRDHKSLGPNRTYTHECRRRTTTQTWQGIMSAGDANPHRRGRAQEAGGQTGKASTTHTHDTHWQVCREAAVGTNAGAGVSASMQLHAQVGMQSNQTPGSWNNQAQHATT